MADLFYVPVADADADLVRLDEEESRHLLTVLRRQVGDRLRLTDGKGVFYTAEIAEAGKKQVVARILERLPVPPERPARLHLAAALTKNIERFEWLLEKATEIGIDIITPIRCKRSERDVIRLDRLEKILVSAMKQSLRAYLPRLNPLTPLADVIRQAAEPQKRIAWCADTPLPFFPRTIEPLQDLIVLIGPEGDFTPEEVQLALQHGFSSVSLGAARLRTETAALYAVACYSLRC